MRRKGILSVLFHVTDLIFMCFSEDLWLFLLYLKLLRNVMLLRSMGMLGLCYLAMMLKLVMTAAQTLFMQGMHRLALLKMQILVHSFC